MLKCMPRLSGWFNFKFSEPAAAGGFDSACTCRVSGRPPAWATQPRPARRRPWAMSMSAVNSIWNYQHLRLEPWLLWLGTPEFIYEFMKHMNSYIKNKMNSDVNSYMNSHMNEFIYDFIYEFIYEMFIWIMNSYMKWLYEMIIWIHSLYESY